jgi:Ca2+-binding RTX toxin-like protein
MRLLLIALFATLLLAAPASAARFAHAGDDLAFTTAASDTVRVTAAEQSPQLAFTRGTGGTLFTVGTGCTLASGVARCDVPAGVLRFTTNDRADVIDASATGDASMPERFDTRGGDDVLTAGPLADEVRAGAGRDTITGGGGPDTLLGEAGDDVFVGLSAGDVIDGGDGTDALDLSGEVVGMTVSLDELLVETVIGTLGDDVLIGGAGNDRLQGGSGADRIEARDGGADTVDCGPGSDVAIVDETDSVTGCESVELPGAANAAPVEPAPIVDADRDGVVAGVDCDDTRAAVRPGAREIPGNRVDENCDGDDARLSAVRGRLSFDFTAFPNGTTRVDRLVVRELQSGGRAELRCKGRCAFRKKVGKARDGKVNLRRLIRGRLRTGATLEVRLSAPDTITRVVRFKMRRGKLPKRTSLCQVPGESVGRCAA